MSYFWVVCVERNRKGAHIYFIKGILKEIGHIALRKQILHIFRIKAVTDDPRPLASVLIIQLLSKVSH